MELPNEEDLRWIISRYAHLRAEHGEAIGTPELVEPTAEFFPDAFSPSPDGVAALVRRMLTYAPVLPLVRGNAPSGSQHPQWRSASKPFTRGSRREIRGRLPRPTR